MTAILPSTALALLALCAVVHASDLSQFITAHEGVRLCVYMDTSNIRTICVGLNVQQPSAKALIQAEGGNYTAIRYGPVCPYTKCYSLRCPSQDTACAAASSTGQGCITTPRGCDNILVQQLASFEQEVQRSFDQTSECGCKCPPIESDCRSGYLALVDITCNRGIGNTRAALGSALSCTCDSAQHCSRDWASAAQIVRTMMTRRGRVWCSVVGPGRCNDDASGMETCAAPPPPPPPLPPPSPPPPPAPPPSTPTPEFSQELSSPEVLIPAIPHPSPSSPLTPSGSESEYVEACDCPSDHPVCQPATGQCYPPGYTPCGSATACKASDVCQSNFLGADGTTGACWPPGYILCGTYTACGGNYPVCQPYYRQPDGYTGQCYPAGYTLCGTRACGGTVPVCQPGYLWTDGSTGACWPAGYTLCGTTNACGGASPVCQPAARTKDGSLVGICFPAGYTLCGTFSACGGSTPVCQPNKVWPYGNTGTCYPAGYTLCGTGACGGDLPVCQPDFRIPTSDGVNMGICAPAGSTLCGTTTCTPGLLCQPDGPNVFGNTGTCFPPPVDHNGHKA